MRDKLIDILGAKIQCGVSFNICRDYPGDMVTGHMTSLGEIADHLIARGVTINEPTNRNDQYSGSKWGCIIGDRVYFACGAGGSKSHTQDGAPGRVYITRVTVESEE